MGRILCEMYWVSVVLAEYTYGGLIGGNARKIGVKNCNSQFLFYCRILAMLLYLVNVGLSGFGELIWQGGGKLVSAAELQPFRSARPASNIAARLVVMAYGFLVSPIAVISDCWEDKQSIVLLLFAMPRGVLWRNSFLSGHLGLCNSNTAHNDLRQWDLQLAINAAQRRNVYIYYQKQMLAASFESAMYCDVCETIPFDSILKSTSKSSQSIYVPQDCSACEPEKWLYAHNSFPVLRLKQSNIGYLH